jgi:hypothetical protein
MKIKLVEISWIDAEASKEGWSDDDPEKEPTILKTYGLLVRRDKHFTVHASTRDPDTGKWSERGKIPTGMVKAIKVISTVEV